jgi:hypothetical protein
MVANTRFLAKYANVREGSSTACQRYYIYEFPEIPVSTTNLPFVIVHDPPAGAYGYGKFRPKGVIHTILGNGKRHRQT